MPWTPPIPPRNQPPGPPLAPEEMDLLVARAGLTLNPGQMADLVLAWRQLGAMIAALPRHAVLDEDRSPVFQLPPPAAAAKPARGKSVEAKPPAGKPVDGKAAAGKQIAVGKSPAGKLPAGKSSAGKSVRRG